MRCEKTFDCLRSKQHGKSNHSLCSVKFPSVRVEHYRNNDLTINCHKFLHGCRTIIAQRAQIDVKEQRESVHLIRNLSRAGSGFCKLQNEARISGTAKLTSTEILCLRKKCYRRWRLSSFFVLRHSYVPNDSDGGVPGVLSYRYYSGCTTDFFLGIRQNQANFQPDKANIRKADDLFSKIFPLPPQSRKRQSGKLTAFYSTV